MSELSPSYLLAGSWVNMLFYGTEIVLGGFYFLNSRSRPNRFFHWSLGISLLIDTTCTAVVCYNAYFYIVLDTAALLSLLQPWMLPVTILCTYHAAMVEQVFLIHRFWHITHNKVVTLLACSLLMAHRSPGYLPLYYSWTQRSRFSVSNSQSLRLHYVLLLIFLSLWLCFVPWIPLRQRIPRHKVRRISIQSVACGFLTSALTITMLSLLVTFNLQPFIVIFDILGRVYTLTILFNHFTLRKPLVNVTGDQTDSAVHRPHSVAFGPMSIPQTLTIPMELSTIDGSSIDHMEDFHSIVHADGINVSGPPKSSEI